MPLISDTFLTSKGFEIANKAANGQTSFTITKVVSSPENISAKSKDEIRKLNNLNSEINSGQIINTDVRSSNLTGIVTQFGNDIYSGGYEVGATGLYVKEANSDNEFLYAVTPMEQNEQVPTVDSNVFSGLQITIYVIAGDSQRMDVSLSKGGDASIDLVEKLISNSEDEIRNKINNDISPRLDSLNNSKADKTEVDNKITDLRNKYHTDGEIKNGYNLNGYTWNGEFVLFDVDINTLEGNEGLPKNSYSHFYGILKVEQISDFPRQTLTDNIGNKWYKYAGNGAIWQQIAYQSYVDDKVKDSFNSANSYTDQKYNDLQNKNNILSSRLEDYQKPNLVDNSYTNFDTVTYGFYETQIASAKVEKGKTYQISMDYDADWNGGNWKGGTFLVYFNDNIDYSFKFNPNQSNSNFHPTNSYVADSDNLKISVAYFTPTPYSFNYGNLQVTETSAKIPFEIAENNKQIQNGNVANKDDLNSTKTDLTNKTNDLSQRIQNSHDDLNNAKADKYNSYTKDDVDTRIAWAKAELNNNKQDKSDSTNKFDWLNTVKANTADKDNDIRNAFNSANSYTDQQIGKYHGTGTIQNGYSLNGFTWNGEFILYNVDLSTLDGHDGLPTGYAHFYGVLKVNNLGGFVRQYLYDNLGSVWYRYSGNGATWYMMGNQYDIDKTNGRITDLNNGKQDKSDSNNKYAYLNGVKADKSDLDNRIKELASNSWRQLNCSGLTSYQGGFILCKVDWNNMTATLSGSLNNGYSSNGKDDVMTIQSSNDFSFTSFSGNMGIFRQSPYSSWSANTTPINAIGGNLIVGIGNGQYRSTIVSNDSNGSSIVIPIAHK